MQEPVSKFRFGSFELDCASGELRKHGLRLKLEDQPFRLLAALVQRHGEIVDRDALKSELWAGDTYVDFDRNLTRAINKVRTALGDSASNPIFLETLPRRGYRFVAPVSLVNGEPPPHEQTPPFEPPPQPPPQPPPFSRRWTIAAMAVLAAGIAIGATFLARRNPSTSISSIAVLPFDGISPGQSFFGDGMTDQLIAALSRHGSLRVVSHKSVVPYRNTTRKLSEVSRELRVDAIVDGSVTQAGGRLRVNARLIHFPNERTAWSKTYEREVGDILALQAELAQNIASEIGIAAALDTGSRAKPVDPELHALYLKGRFLVHEPSKDSIELGIRTLEQVVKRDPGHAPAYAAMAEGWNSLSSVFLPPSVAMPNAKAAARKAVELNPDSDVAHAALGLALLWYDWNWAGAGGHFDKALALNPNSAESYRGLACLRLTTGQREQSIQAAHRAADLAPMSLVTNLFSTFTFYFNQREDDAIRLARATLDWEPKFGLSRAFLGMAYLDRGRHDEAIRELERAAKDQRMPMTISFLAMGYARVGRTQKARALLDEVVALARSQYVCPFEVAVAFASLGEKDEAFSWMRRGLAERADCMIHLRSEPWTAPLRSDPRYAALVREVGFPAVTQ